MPTNDDAEWHLSRDDVDYVPYVPASALSEVWVAFQALFDMVNCALDSRDALLISKTSATMLKAEKLLAARDAALSAGKENNRESISETTDAQRR